MLNLAVVIVLGQTLVPPSAQAPLMIGSPGTPQPVVAGSVGAVAIEGNAIEFVWVDDRLSLGDPAAVRVKDLWWGRQATRGGPLVSRMLARGSVLASSPTIALNGQNRLIGWVEGPLAKLSASMTSVLPGPPITLGVSGVHGLAVANWNGAFAVAVTTASNVGVINWPIGGASPTLPLLTPPTQLALAPGSNRLLLAIGQSGGVLQTSVTSVIEPGEERMNVRLGGISPGRNELVVYRPSLIPTEVAAIAFDGGLETTLTSVRSSSVLATGVGQTTFFVTAGGPGPSSLARSEAGVISLFPTGAGEPIAIAASPTTGAIVHGAGDLQLSVFDPQAFSPTTPTTISFAPSMREPSVAWSSPLGSFVVAWEEREYTGVERWVPHLSVLSLDGGQREFTLSDLASLEPTGVRVSQSSLDQVMLSVRKGLTTEFSEFSADGGVGARSSLRGFDWRLSAAPTPVPFHAVGGKLELWLDSERSTTLSATRCAAGTSAGSIFAGWLGVAQKISLLSVNALDGGLSGPTPLSFTAPPADAICVTASSSSPEVALAWADQSTVRVARLAIDLSTNVVTGEQTFSLMMPPQSAPARPEAAIVPDGLLVASELGPDFSSLSAALIRADGGVVPYTVTNTGGLGLRSPHFSVSSEGIALLVWQEFDSTLGATRIRGRLVLPARPSVSSDAGLGTDAGSIDAGLFDGGDEPDAGNDAGLVDGGTNGDGGLVSSDGGGRVTFVPACSCRASDQLTGPFLLLLAFGPRWRALRRRAG